MKRHPAERSADYVRDECAATRSNFVLSSSGDTREPGPLLMTTISTHDKNRTAFTTTTTTATAKTGDSARNRQVASSLRSRKGASSAIATAVKGRRAKDYCASFSPTYSAPGVRKYWRPSAKCCFSSAVAPEDRSFSRAKEKTQSCRKRKTWCSFPPLTSAKKKCSFVAHLMSFVLAFALHIWGVPNASAVDRRSPTNMQGDTPDKQQNAQVNLVTTHDFAVPPTRSLEELQLFPWENYHGRAVECEVCQCIVALVYEQLERKFPFLISQKGAYKPSGTDGETEAGVALEALAGEARSKAEAVKAVKDAGQSSATGATAAEAARELPALTLSAGPSPSQAAPNNATPSREPVEVELPTTADMTAAARNFPKVSQSTAAAVLTTERRSYMPRGEEGAYAPVRAAPALLENKNTAAAVEATPHVSGLLSRKQQIAWTVAVNEIIDSARLCTFGHWKFYADKTEDMHVYEMTTACKSLLAGGGDEALEKSILHNYGDSQAASRAFCLHTHCTTLWPDYDHPRNRETQSDRNLRLAKAFLGWNREQLGIHETVSGLQYRLEGDTVHMHYLGKTLNGNTFENTFRQGRATVVRFGHLVPGWKEALQMMNTGDEMHVYIPPHLGFGEAGLGNKVKSNELVMLHLRLEHVERSSSSPPDPSPTAAAGSTRAASRNSNSGSARTNGAAAAAAQLALRHAEL